MIPARDPGHLLPGGTNASPSWRVAFRLYLR